MKVLIVDDEKLTREGLRDKIDWAGLGFTDVRCADDGMHGLELGRQFRPDVILTDVRMPRMNGIQMSEQIQQLCPESSIVIMSGYSDKEYLKAAIRLRAVSYVEKPINLDEITAALKEAVVRVENENRNRTQTKYAVAFELTQYPEQRNNLNPDPSWFRIPLEEIRSAFTVIIQSYDPDRMTTAANAQVIDKALSPLFEKMSLERLYTFRSPLYIFQFFSRREISDRQMNYFGQRIVEELMNVLRSFHVIIGKQIRDYRNLHESYESAVIKLQAVFFQPVNTYYSSGQVSEKITFRSLNESDYENELRQILKDRDCAALDKFSDDLLAGFTDESSYILPNQVRDLYYRLHSVLHSVCRSMQISLDSSMDSGVVWNDISACNTVYELSDLFRKNIRAVYDAMNKPTGESETVYTIKSYIARSYSDPGLSIKEISSYAHLSTSYICTLFKNETGMTLNQFITEYRMERARDLLDDPRNKIVEVAGTVGYNDSNYFSKTFRKAFGISPSEYREQRESGGEL